MAKKPKLTVMVGLSGSGKSTIAKEIANTTGAVIVSSDAIREELFGTEECQDDNAKVFRLFYEKIKDVLMSGEDVIADATNLTMKSRRAIFQNVAKIDCIKEAHIAAKDVEECIRDNNKRERVVPECVIREQCKRFEVPFYEEGFDEILITYSNPKRDADYVADIIQDMMNFDQCTPHHSETLGNHCLSASTHFSQLGYPAHLEMAARLHDIGKLLTQTFDEEGIAHYYNHENVGAYLLLNKLPSFDFTQKEMLDFLFLVNYHMRPFSWTEEKTHEKYRRIFGEEKYRMLVDFHECDKMREEPENYQEQER